MTRNRHIQLLTIEYAANARGVVKTHSYEQARGLLLGTTYSDGTTARTYTYNHLGLLTQVVDDAGPRTIGYNSYGERESDSLMVDGDTHFITETRDVFGRSTGFVYSKNGTVQQTVTTGYGTDGRISSAGFTHGGEVKQFGYEYLSGTNMLHKLTKPNGMTLTQTYESTRDLLTGMAYHRGSTLVAQREYTYDILGRPTARNTARQGAIVNDTFVHNTCSELIEAKINGKNYEYVYDNIGNRTAAVEDSSVVANRSEYSTNSLNQYTSIAVNGGVPFIPQFDADGNQTLIKTDTGIWSALYNAENRPVSFTNRESNTVVECQYDSMGRRSYKKVTVNGNVTLHQRYIYRGYLQIASIDLTRSHHPVMWLVTWDPTQPVATRPLAIRINGTWYTYGWDLTKNICELYSTEGRISTSYTYSPFGKVTATGSLTQPIQWSSEIWDSELGLMYYNWRYYNTMIGRWICRDKIHSANLYNYSQNNNHLIDLLGMLNVNIKVHPHTVHEEPNVRIPYLYRDNIFISDSKYYTRIFNEDEQYTYAITTAYANINDVKINCHSEKSGIYCPRSISIDIHIMVIINKPFVFQNIIDTEGTHIMVPTRNKKGMMPYSIIYKDELDHVKDIKDGFMDKKLHETIKEKYTKVINYTLENCERTNKITLIELLREEYQKISTASSIKYDEGNDAPHYHTESSPFIKGSTLEEDLKAAINSISVP